MNRSDKTSLFFSSYDSNSSSTFGKSLGVFKSVPIIIGINVIFKFYNFLNSHARSYYLYLSSFSLIFSLWSPGTAKSTIL